MQPLYCDSLQLATSLDGGLSAGCRWNFMHSRSAYLEKSRCLAEGRARSFVRLRWACPAATARLIVAIIQTKNGIFIVFFGGRKKLPPPWYSEPESHAIARGALRGKQRSIRYFLSCP